MNKNNPALNVSVILPVYFDESSLDNLNLLARAVTSVHIQKFPSDYEILIIDDGSATPISDFTYLLGPDLLHKVKFIRLTRNSGLVNALNVGLCDARYPWIARLDADDCWLETKIEKQFSLIATDSNLTIAATGMTRIEPSGKEIDTHIRSGNWKNILRFFIDIGCPFPHGSVLARRDIYRLLGGYSHDPAFSHCEDFALWGIWLRFFKPGMVEEALYNYTVASRSVSALNSEQQERASKEVRKKFSDLNLAESLPEILSDVSKVLGCSLLDSGILAYKIWRFSPVVALPSEAIHLLQRLLPDRQLFSPKNACTTMSVKQVIGQTIDPNIPIYNIQFI